MSMTGDAQEFDRWRAVDQEIERQWDFDDPSRSERLFRDWLTDGGSDAPGVARLAVRTQVARAQGLQRRFDEAHRALDEIERELATAVDASVDACWRELVAIMLALERGRVYNSSANPLLARAMFQQAWDAATSLSQPGVDALAVDAAHMLAIVATDAADAWRWNHAALEIAERSRESRARRWRASLHNNIGWVLHGSGDFAAAHAAFERALELRHEQGRPREIRIARWCVGRSLRSLGRLDEALALQRALLDESEGADADAYVFEEVGECLIALGRVDAAREHLSRATELLSRDVWLTEREPARIARLQSLANGAPDLAGGSPIERGSGC